MDITIRIEDLATPALNRLDRRLPEALALGMDDATMLLLREMKVYPTQRPPRNNKLPYRRTGTLGRSWFRRVKRTGSGATGEVFSAGNIAPYNVYVQHHALQAAVHRGVWSTEVQVEQRLHRQVLTMFERRIQAAMR